MVGDRIRFKIRTRDGRFEADAVAEALVRANVSEREARRAA